MGEEISQLVDGELELGHVDRLCARLAEGQALETWVAYHMIGDALRRQADLSPGFHERFSKRLAEEPTVLAPAPRRASRSVFVPWAAAASLAAIGVVGWFGVRELQTPQLAPMAQIQVVEKASLGAAKPAQGTQFNDYLMVHQAYSPATTFQGVRPYIRTVSDSGREAR